MAKKIQAYPLLRKNDKYLMKKVMQITNEAKEINHIKYYRLYFNVITTSDKAGPDGKYLCSEVYKYNKASTCRQKSCIRCNQQIPEKCH
jgi:hypothetical protein